MDHKKAGWILFASGVAALGGFLVRQGLNQAWRVATDEDPPEDPTAWDVEWRDAIAWTVATGVVMGLGRLLARRGAAAGWERLTGEHPPN
ncbi:MAG TPA: DUF4235 domain-containing protein [Longimicrobiales bacterium]|nr:DUF4235 domain-containing protein [Longimicrobiales bacterium]